MYWPHTSDKFYVLWTSLVWHALVWYPVKESGKGRREARRPMKNPLFSMTPSVLQTRHVQQPVNATYVADVCMCTHICMLCGGGLRW